MTYVPLSYIPGVVKTISPYATSKESGGVDGRPVYGRFIDMDGVRFAGGYPEKIGGSTLLYSSALTGVPRGLRDWRDFDQVIYLGIGTNAKLYYYSDSMVHDITPLRVITSGTLVNALSTTNGTAIVNVHSVAHNQLAGEYVILTSDTDVGGIRVAGVYHITSVVDVDNYTITILDTATSTQLNGGGNTTYSYFRKSLTNPFSTVNGSSTVTVAHTSHGASVGDYVTYSNASAVGGLTIDGQYVITGTSANTYTITASSNATSTASGGGTVYAEYDIAVGLVDSALAYGYGTGGYGSGTYGTAGTSGIQLDARTWSLSKYGQQLLANPIGGTIYVWDPDIGGRAYPLYNAPAIVRGMFVTPERFVIALGINDNPMKIAWPDQDDYTQWTSLPDNTANEGRTLQEGSIMIGGISTRNGISMLFSDTSAYNLNYTGDNSVYETPLAGRKCGLIGPMALTVLGDEVFWMSDKDLWNWNGAVHKLPSDDIRDFVFDDINLSQSAKFEVKTIAARNEVLFMYCSEDSDENDLWVKWTTDASGDQPCWSSGSVMPRSSWLDKELFDYPIATSSAGYIYYQEYGSDDNGAPLDSFIEFCPFDISNGDSQMDVFGFIPDFAYQTGNISLTINMQDYPKSATTTDGPFTIADDSSTPIIDLRSNGRLVGYRLESNVLGGKWRLGLPRVDAQPAGKRR